MGIVEKNDASWTILHPYFMSTWSKILNEDIHGPGVIITTSSGPVELGL